MIASEFNLLPCSLLHEHEDTVLHRLDSLPTTYRKDLLHDPQVRYPFLYYLLFTHWPELLNGVAAGVTREEADYNAYYWFRRLSLVHQKKYGPNASIEQQAFQLLESSELSVGPEPLLALEEKVAREFANNEWEIAVAFGDFSIGEVKRQFGLILDESGDHFAGISPVAPSPWLGETLREGVPLALAIGTEKARSELIIAPVLVEIRRQLSHRISLFSGVEWTVD